MVWCTKQIDLFAAIEMHNMVMWVYMYKMVTIQWKEEKSFTHQIISTQY